MFLFEMQNVTAAYFTILYIFNYLIQIKKLIFQWL